MQTQRESKTKFNLWEYFYYRATLFYSQREKGLGLGDNKNTAAFYVGTCILLNVETVYLIVSNTISVATDNKGSGLLEDNLFYYISTAVFVITIVVSLYYFANRRSDKIFKQYHNETNQQKKKRGKLILIYIIGTFLIPFLVGFINRKYVLGV